MRIDLQLRSVTPLRKWLHRGHHVIPCMPAASNVIAVHRRDHLQRDLLRARARTLADIRAACQTLPHSSAPPSAAHGRPSPACPCGKLPRWVIFAPVNSAAEAFGQAATQAPQPMQAAASMAWSAASFETGIAFPSGALPVDTETYPPDAMMRSNERRSTTKSLITGNGRARQGSSVNVFAVFEVAHCQLANRCGPQRTVRHTIDHEPARTANAFAAVVFESDRLFPRSISCSFKTSRHSSIDMSGLTLSIG